MLPVVMGGGSATERVLENLMRGSRRRWGDRASGGNSGDAMGDEEFEVLLQQLLVQHDAAHGASPAASVAAGI